MRQTRLKVYAIVYSPLPPPASSSSYVPHHPGVSNFRMTGRARALPFKCNKGMLEGKGTPLLRAFARLDPHWRRPTLIGQDGIMPTNPWPTSLHQPQKHAVGAKQDAQCTEKSTSPQNFGKEAVVVNTTERRFFICFSRAPEASFQNPFPLLDSTDLTDAQPLIYE